MTKKSILDFVEQEEDFNEVHDELITDIVTPYLVRVTDGNRREYNQKFYVLSGAKKILIDALVLKALFHKRPGAFEKEAIKPKEIAENKILNISSDVAKKVFNRELKKIFRNIGEGYVIPNSRIKMIKEEFFKKNG